IVAPHATCRLLVPTGQALDFGFVPLPAALGFLGRDNTRAMQFGHVGWMPLRIGGEKGFNVGDCRVIAKDAQIVSMNVDLPFLPVPQRKTKACSMVSPVRS